MSPIPDFFNDSIILCHILSSILTALIQAFFSMLNSGHFLIYFLQNCFSVNSSSTFSITVHMLGYCCIPLLLFQHSFREKTQRMNILKTVGLSRTNSLFFLKHIAVSIHLLLPSIFPSIRIFSNESALCSRWPKYWSSNISYSPCNEYCFVLQGD